MAEPVLLEVPPLAVAAAAVPVQPVRVVAPLVQRPVLARRCRVVMVALADREMLQDPQALLLAAVAAADREILVARKAAERGRLAE